MEWVFDGIGTQIIVGVVSLLVGGAAGSGITYRRMSRRLSQRQHAGDNASQMQVGRDFKGTKP